MRRLTVYSTFAPPVEVELPLFAAQARATDPQTSRDAAAALDIDGETYRRLLDAFRSSGDAGMTDEEAITAAGLDEARGWWKRCSELRNAGAIVPTGETRRSPTTGRARMVCRVATDRVRAIGGGIHPA